MMSKNKFLVIFLYIALGYYILTIDTDAFVLYVTILPIQYWFFIKAIKMGYVSLIVFYALLFIPLGINSFTFFINREKYSPTGMAAVGNFDFTLSSYYNVYSFFFIYSLALLFFSSFFFYILHIRPSFGLLKTNISRLFFSISTDRAYDRWFFLLSIFLSIMSIWMYKNQLGIVGMQQKELPFHLTGFLFYFRRYILTFLLVFLYFKSTNKNFGYIILMITSIIVGVCSSSRSLAVFLLFPVVFESFSSNKKMKFVISLIVMIIVYQFISVSRNFLYSAADVSYGISELLSLGYSALRENETPSVFNLLNEISGRFFGGADIIVASQSHFTSLGDLFIYYMGLPKSWIVTDVEETIYGVSLPPDMAFGMGLGYTQMFILLSNGSYMLALIQSLLVAFYFALIEKVSLSVLASEAPIYFRILPVFITSFSLFSVFIGEPFSFMIASIFFSFLLHKYFKLKKQRSYHKVLLPV